MVQREYKHVYRPEAKTTPKSGTLYDVDMIEYGPENVRRSDYSKYMSLVRSICW